MITLPAQIDSIRSLKDGSVKVTLETQELTPSAAGDLFSLQGKFCYVAFKLEHFRREEIDALESLKADYQETGKTPSQRLRNILHVWFKQEPQGFDSFTLFYEHHLEKLCDHFKGKLNP